MEALFCDFEDEAFEKLRLEGSIQERPAWFQVLPFPCGKEEFDVHKKASGALTLLSPTNRHDAIDALAKSDYDALKALSAKLQDAATAFAQLSIKARQRRSDEALAKKRKA